MRSIVAGVMGAACLIACLSEPVVAAPVPLEPVKPWDLDYGEAQCTAIREYGSVANPITLAIIPALDASSFELIATYKRTAPQFAEEFEGKVDFGSRWVSTWALKYGDGNLTMYQFRLAPSDMTQARSAQRLGLQLHGELDVRFTLDHMSELLDGLQKCTSDLQDFWNFGRHKDGHIVVPAKGDIRAEFTANDYPLDAQRHMKGGTAQYILLVNEKGAVAGCHVLVPSGVPDLDAEGCLVIQQRSKFIPAKDARGDPVRSAVTTPKITWRIAD